ncbi:Hypothetical protein A7982_01989 [Minicystis rosea]|nr:Hypothetical protein A7982_01989 [Minicystis rosea]
MHVDRAASGAHRWCGLRRLKARRGSNQAIVLEPLHVID